MYLKRNDWYKTNRSGDVMGYNGKDDMGFLMARYDPVEIGGYHIPKNRCCEAIIRAVNSEKRHSL